ncbi:MAG TPA: hypothetical protein VK897_03625 [Anaerolineales bacterium]|nr:hypothetical protein [Anaerolineales bacterium]
MLCKSKAASILSILAVVLTSLACAALQTAAASPSTREPTATVTATPTNTPRPSPTLRPTQTPNLTATQQIENINNEIQSFHEMGYLSSTEGQLVIVDDFRYEWAQLGWYNRLPLWDSVSDFFLSAHFKWDSALETSNVSGCGFIFGLQPNDDHYAVFLDRTQVYFLITDHALGYSKPISPTRGTGRVNFDYPAEADFTLIVKDAYAYVLVNGELTGEYTLAQSRPPEGKLALTVLSGTNKDYGTRCEMTNLHLWIPKQ